jgi:hypothetical protein
MMTRLLATFAAAALVLLAVPAGAQAGYDCVTRKSGSTTITTCGSGKTYSRCRSYRSGSITKTS